MALPAYQPYGTVQNSFNQMTGQSPIGYNVPLNRLRQGSDRPRVSPNGDLSNEEIIENMAQKQANKLLAGQRAAQLNEQGNWANRLNVLENLKVSPGAARSIYDSAYNMGYVSERPAFSFPGQQGMYKAGSLEERTYKQGRDMDAARNQAALAWAGVDSREVERAYQKFLKDNLGQ